MNILFVTENFFPDVMGGSGRIVTETGKHLHRLGNRVHIITRQVEKTPRQSVVDGLSIRRYSCDRGVWRTIHAIKNAIARETDATQFDVCIICQPLPGIAALRSRSLRSTPKIREFYGPWHEEYRVKVCGENRGSLIPMRVEKGSVFAS